MVANGLCQRMYRRTPAANADKRRVVTEYRFVISLALAAIVGAAGLRVWPVPSDHPLLELIAAHCPMVYAGFMYAYVTVWFSTPFVLISNVVIGTTRPLSSSAHVRPCPCMS